LVSEIHTKEKVISEMYDALPKYCQIALDNHAQMLNDINESKPEASSNKYDQ